MKKKKKKKENAVPGRIQVIAGQDDVARYNEKRERTHKGIPVALILFLVWVGIYFGSIIFRFRIERYGYDSWYLNGTARVFQSISESVRLLFRSTQEHGWGMELYQYLGIAAAGAALASCGTVFQGAFKNVLAGPSTMGVMSGGSLGGMAYLLIFYFYGVSAEYLQQFAILAGCFGGVLFILSVSLLIGRGKVSAPAMVVCGTVFSGVVSNVMMVVQYYLTALDSAEASEIIEELGYMMMGSFQEMIYPRSVLMMGIPIVACLVILVCSAGKLNVLALGEEEAAAAGLNARRCRNLVVVAGTVLTAIVVSFCGRIGFIGFMVPLVVRKLTGPDLRKLLPAAIFGGAIVTTLIYDLAYSLGMENYLSVITGPLGCVVMLVTLLKKGGGADGGAKRGTPARMGF